MHNNQQERQTASESYKPVHEAAEKSSRDESFSRKESSPTTYRFDAFMRIIRD